MKCLNFGEGVQVMHFFSVYLTNHIVDDIRISTFRVNNNSVYTG